MSPGSSASDSPERRCIELLQRYVRIDTSNPPGRTVEAVEFLEAELGALGGELRRITSNDNKPNLVATFQGADPALPPLVLLHHIDVVPAGPASDWSAPPFGGEIVDDHLYGRGVLDMKGMGILELVALQEFLADGNAPDRTILYVAVADEEVGGDDGAGVVVTELAAKLGNARVLNEGTYGLEALMGRPLFPLGAGEKGLLWLELTARGVGGHASMPLLDNPNEQLIRGLPDLLDSMSGFCLVPQVREFLVGLLGSRGVPRSLSRNVLPSLMAMPGVNRLVARLPKLGALLRNTVSVTILDGGEKENVIPTEARAVIDVRTLPGHATSQMLERIGAWAEPRGIGLRMIQSVEASWNEGDPEGLERLLAVFRGAEPDIPAIPTISPGFTDARYFREKGATVYGIIPFLLGEVVLGSIHGPDERVPLRELERGTRIMIELVAAFAAA